MIVGSADTTERGIGGALVLGGGSAGGDGTAPAKEGGFGAAGTADGIGGATPGSGAGATPGSGAGATPGSGRSDGALPGDAAAIGVADCDQNEIALRGGGMVPLPNGAALLLAASPPPAGGCACASAAGGALSGGDEDLALAFDCAETEAAGIGGGRLALAPFAFGCAGKSCLAEGP